MGSPPVGNHPWQQLTCNLLPLHWQTPLTMTISFSFAWLTLAFLVCSAWVRWLLVTIPSCEIFRKSPIATHLNGLAMSTNFCYLPTKWIPCLRGITCALPKSLVHQTHSQLLKNTFIWGTTSSLFTPNFGFMPMVLPWHVPGSFTNLKNTAPLILLDNPCVWVVQLHSPRLVWDDGRWYAYDAYKVWIKPNKHHKTKEI